MKQIAHAGQEAAFATPDGAQRRVLSYGGSLMLVQFTFAAGVSSARHSHPHEQIGYVVSGEIDLVMDGMEDMEDASSLVDFDKICLKMRFFVLTGVKPLDPHVHLFHAFTTVSIPVRVSDW